MPRPLRTRHRTSIRITRNAENKAMILRFLGGEWERTILLLFRITFSTTQCCERKHSRQYENDIWHNKILHFNIQIDHSHWAVECDEIESSQQVCSNVSCRTEQTSGKKPSATDDRRSCGFLQKNMTTSYLLFTSFWFKSLHRFFQIGMTKFVCLSRLQVLLSKP